jgi:hypothetical protein
MDGRKQIYIFHNKFLNAAMDRILHTEPCRKRKEKGIYVVKRPRDNRPSRTLDTKEANHKNED